MSTWRGCFGARSAWVLVGMLACARGFAAPLDVLRDCAAHASPALVGISSLGRQCPQLNAALAALGIEPMLYDGWQERLNRDALEDLVRLAETYDGSAPTTAPDIAALPGVLKTLQGDRSLTPKSWWDAGIAWFKGWLSRHSDALNWLNRWLGQIGRATTLFDLITFGLIALVLVAALALVVRELKAGGTLRRRRSAERPASTQRDPAAYTEDSEDVARTTLEQRLTELLRAIVSRLVQTRRLTAERSLTHRELVSRSAFDSESQRAVFAAVAGSAEAMLYGAHAAPPEDLDRMLQEGGLLLAHIEEASRAR